MFVAIVIANLCCIDWEIVEPDIFQRMHAFDGLSDVEFESENRPPTETRTQHRLHSRGPPHHQTQTQQDPSQATHTTRKPKHNRRNQSYERLVARFFELFGFD